MELMALVIHLGILTAIDTSCVVHPHLIVLGFAMGVERDADALGVFEGDVELLVDVLVGHAIGGDCHWAALLHLKSRAP